MQENDLITPAEAARRKGVSVPTIYKAVAEHRLRAVEILGRIGIRTQDLDAYQPGSYGGTVRARIQRGPGRRRNEPTT